MAEKIGFDRVGGSSTEEQDLGQIREILFGDQHRQTTGRLARIEARLGEQESILRDLIGAQIDKAVQQLRDELGHQEQRQASALDDIETALRTELQKTAERLALLDSDIQDTGHQTTEALAGLTRSLERLRHDSVDRDGLATVFEGLAQQLRKVPDR